LGGDEGVAKRQKKKKDEGLMTKGEKMGMSEKNLKRWGSGEGNCRYRKKKTENVILPKEWGGSYTVRGKVWRKRGGSKLMG